VKSGDDWASPRSRSVASALTALGPRSEPGPMPITLSRRQIGDADRVGGIELMIVWPDALGPEPDVPLDHEREATQAEKAHAEGLVGEACRTAGLVPVHVRVCRLRRPKSLGGKEGAHLAVTIIGERWVHASTKSRGRVSYAAEPQYDNPAPLTTFEAAAASSAPSAAVAAASPEAPACIMPPASEVAAPIPTPQKLM